MKITRQILKDNRERKGISISEVAIATKINTKTVMALEEGDLDRLPPKTFLRGFVRAYATFLDLDVESVMNTFYEEMGSTKPKTQPEEEVAKARSTAGEADNAINPKASLSVKIGAVTGILLLVVLIVFFKNKMESYEKETIVEGMPNGIESIHKDIGSDPNLGPSPSSSPSDAQAAAAAPSASSSPSSASPAPSSASPTPSSATAAVPAATASPQATAAPSPVPNATPTASPAPKATATPMPSPSPTPKTTPSPSPSASPNGSPTPTPSPVTARAQDIIIEALRNVDIEATIDGEAKTFKLNAEQVQQIKAKRKVILRFSDGGGVNLTVNGRDRGVPGDLGKPLKIELP
jgi:cytoskeleton protein RodZ